MKFLVDANVLSEPTRAEPNERVVEWLRKNERELVIDPIVLGELRFGILLLARGRKRQRLERWFEDGIERITCLSWDAATGLRWAKLLAELRAAGQAIPIKDSMIAATALRHDLTIVTRNSRDFAKATANVLDPFE